MGRKCRACLCRTCLRACKCVGCERKIEYCENYIDFEQLSIFEQSSKPQHQAAPRRSLQHYGISKERYRQLTEYIQSGRYASIALQAAHRADGMIAEYILLSATQNKSYESLEKMWARGKIEKIPCSRTGFYGTRRFFYHLFDLEMKKIEK